MHIQSSPDKVSLRKAAPWVSLVLAAGAWSGLNATPQPPPRLCLDDVQCVEARDGYTLASIGEIPFAYSTPIPPTITSEVTVTPATLAANKVNGRRIILSAGNYGNQTFNTQDQEIVFLEGAQFGHLNIGSSAARLVFRGAPARAGLIRGYIDTPASGGPTDLLFDGITQDHATREWTQQNAFHGSRIAVINSSLRAEMMAVCSFPNSVDAQLRDSIFANNLLHSFGGTQAGNRFHGAIRHIFVDNRVIKTGSTHHSYRLHAGSRGGVSIHSDNVFIARNEFTGSGHQIVGSGWGLEVEPGVGRLINVWYQDNEQYAVSNTGINIGNSQTDYYDLVEVFRFTGNRLFANDGGWPSQMRPQWTVSGNTVQSYVTPPPWNFQ